MRRSIAGEGPLSRICRVLLVEDDDDQRSLLASLLREAGHEPVPARSAEDGLAIIRETDDDCAPDIAIFDVQLPGMNGLRALKVVAEERPGLPVVLLTASGDVREDRAFELGAREFLRKPVSASTFVTAVSKALASIEGTSNSGT